MGQLRGRSPREGESPLLSGCAKEVQEWISAVLLSQPVRSPPRRCPTKIPWEWVPKLGNLCDPATGTREPDCPTLKERSCVEACQLWGSWGAGGVVRNTAFLFPSCPTLAVMEREKKAGKEKRKIGMQLTLPTELLQQARDQKDLNG